MTDYHCCDECGTVIIMAPRVICYACYGGMSLKLGAMYAPLLNEQIDTLNTRSKLTEIRPFWTILHHDDDLAQRIAVTMARACSTCVCSNVFLILGLLTQPSQKNTDHIRRSFASHCHHQKKHPRAVQYPVCTSAYWIDNPGLAFVRLDLDTYPPHSDVSHGHTNLRIVHYCSHVLKREMTTNTHWRPKKKTD